MAFQLHQSGLALLSRCGIAFERRYLKGEKGTRSTSLVVGTAVDRAAALDLTEKKDTGKLLADDIVTDAARDALLQEWNKGDIRLEDADAEEGWTDSRGDAIDASVEMAAHYHQNAAPTIAPVAVQREFVMDVQGAAIPVQLVGTIDIQESGVIRDLKTSGKSPQKDTAHNSIQLTTYALALRQIDGALPEMLVLDYVVRTPKRHDIKLVQLETRRTDADLQPLAQRVYAAAETIKAGLFTPADPSSWWCSKKFCSFWASCPYAVRPVSVAAPVPIDNLEAQLRASLAMVQRRKEGYGSAASSK